MIALRRSLMPGQKTLLFALVIATTPACITEPDTVTNDASNALIQIVNMAGVSETFGGAGDPVSDVFSDVCFADETHPPCTLFNDNGVVTMAGIAKDRGQPSSLINNVTFQRYRVTYVRADGRNVPGVDVPYPFDGVANFEVPLTGVAAEPRTFLLVRHQAKAESPLREITFNRSMILSVIGQVDFYGVDGAGRSVMATGYINITFGDFANEE